MKATTFYDDPDVLRRSARARRGHGRHQRRGDPAPRTGWPSAAGKHLAWRSRRSSISSSSRSTSTAAAFSARNRVIGNGRSAATSPVSRWCRRCGPSIRNIKCTLCTATSCDPEMPRRPRYSSSSGCATAAPSPPGESTPFSMGRPSSPCRPRFRPTRRASITRTRCRPRPPPEDLPGLAEIKAFDDAGFRQFAEREIRVVPQEKLARLPGKASQQQVWFRHRDPLPDDSVLHICALAYMSDLTCWVRRRSITRRSASTCRSRRWIMRCGSWGAFRADEWLLYDQSSPSSSGDGR